MNLLLGHPNQECAADALLELVILNGDGLLSHTSAHDVLATVAPFRAWRGSRIAVARGPSRPPQQSAHDTLCV